MAFEFLELDDETRGFMLDEMRRDGGDLPPSKRLTARGIRDYPDLLRASLATGTAEELVNALAQEGRMLATPVNAAELFGGTTFNHYYSRGICRRAFEHRVTGVEVYRARQSLKPRPGSAELEGRVLSAQTLLDDLRKNDAGASTQGVALVGSGMSVRCTCDPCQGATS